MFAEADIRVERIALTFAQVTEYGPPPNPAKLSDSRAGGYVDKYGLDSWELDALEPATIVALVRHTVTSLMDADAWQAEQDIEAEEKEQIQVVADHWPEALEAARDTDGG